MRIFKLVALVTVLAVAGLYARPGRENLQPWYDWYNVRYFGGTLPKSTVTQWADLSLQDAMGQTRVEGGRYVIQIDAVTNRASVTTHESLIHEMCHVWVAENIEQPLPDGDHGVAFQDCMMDKAKQGAFHDLW
jgi:hypothetical protein